MNMAKPNRKQPLNLSSQIILATQTGRRMSETGGGSSAIASE